jgi:hypothetical protein
MKRASYSILLFFAIIISGCKGGKTNDGQLIGSQDRPEWDNNLMPYGMVYIPSGVIHIRPIRPGYKLFI